MGLCANLDAVPAREFMSLENIPDATLLRMREEMRLEVARIKPQLREQASKRNGLDGVELEVKLRELAEHRLSLKSLIFKHPLD